MRLPKTWHKITAGHYAHLETGVEIRKAGREWSISVPSARRASVPVGTVNSLTAAEEASGQWVTTVRDMIAKAWDDAHFQQIGRPDSWAEGQADDATVDARHAAVAATGTPTGYDATPGQLVIHLELGIPGVYVENHGTLSYVRFAGDAEKSPVHSADVVVLTGLAGWFSCKIMDDPAHDTHGEATTPECLVDEPDQELTGPELVRVGRGRYATADGVEVIADKDGTWSAWGLPSTPYNSNSICCGQKTKGRTYRWINRRRAEMAVQVEKDHGLALDVAAAMEALTAARTNAATVKTARAAAIAKGQPGGGWAAIQQIADIAGARAALAVEILLRRPNADPVRFVMVEVTYDEGSTWDIISGQSDSAEPSETPSAHALRYAIYSGLGPDDDRPTVPRAWRVRVWSDPQTTEHDGEWTNLTDPCEPGQHDTGRHPIGSGPRRTDGSVVQFACCSLCFHGVWRVSPYRDAPTPWLLEGEPLPEPAADVISLPIECVLTRHYGMEINDGLGTWLPLIGVGPVDRETGRVEVTAGDRTGKLYATTLVQLRPASPGPDGPDPDSTQTQTQTRTQTSPAASSPASFGYRVQTRTLGSWTTVRTGTIPPMWNPAPSGLAVAAETVLGNAGPVLGLGPTDQLPTVRVRTWHRQTGLTQYVIRNA